MAMGELSPDTFWVKIGKYIPNIDGQLSTTSCFRYFTYYDSFNLFETLRTSSRPLNLKQEKILDSTFLMGRLMHGPIYSILSARAPMHETQTAHPTILKP